MTLEGTIKHGMELEAGAENDSTLELTLHGGLRVTLASCDCDEVVIAFGPIGSYVDMSGYYTSAQTDTLLSRKVDKQAGKGLSSNDYTDAEKTKLANLAGVATSGDYDDLNNKPTIPTVPSNVGAFINDAGYLTEHQSLGNYYTKIEVNRALGNKQDKLESGSNIKTINGNSVLGSGNINIQGGGGVQSDWNVSDTSSVAYIKNKPTIPTVPTNVSAFNNDAGYLTQHQSLANYYTKSEVNSAIVDSNPVIEDGRTSNTQSVVGVAPFASLVDGQRILLAKLKYSLVNSPTLTLTLSNGTNTAAIPMYCDYSGGSTLKTNWGGILKKNGAIGLIYDGTNNRWIALSHIDTNTTYAAMTQASLETGTFTNGNVVSAKLLRDNFYTKSEINSTIGDIETLLANI